jgi:hypothetical protein
MIRNAAVIGAVVVAILLSWRDLSFSMNGEDDETKIANEKQNAAADFEKPVAEPKLKSHFTGPTLRFLYCYS